MQFGKECNSKNSVHRLARSSNIPLGTEIWPLNKRLVAGFFRKHVGRNGQYSIKSTDWKEGRQEQFLFECGEKTKRSAMEQVRILITFGGNMMTNINDSDHMTPTGPFPACKREEWCLNWALSIQVKSDLKGASYLKTQNDHPWNQTAQRCRYTAQWRHKSSYRIWQSSRSRAGGKRSSKKQQPKTHWQLISSKRDEIDGQIWNCSDEQD